MGRRNSPLNARGPERFSQKSVRLGERPCAKREFSLGDEATSSGSIGLAVVCWPVDAVALAAGGVPTGRT